MEKMLQSLSKVLSNTVLARTEILKTGLSVDPLLYCTACLSLSRSDPIDRQVPTLVEL